MTEEGSAGAVAETDGDMPPGPDGEAQESEEEEQSGNLFPGMELPEEIESLAREMKTAEIARKEQLSIEKEKREDLRDLMAEMDIPKFQIEIDGYDYEFVLEEKSKVKSKKIKHEE